MLKPHHIAPAICDHPLPIVRRPRTHTSSLETLSAQDTRQGLAWSRCLWRAPGPFWIFCGVLLISRLTKW
jgi:hypothetical protein